ncbi:M50 family metallopeptidase [Stieleria varia]|uniref:Peptidase family M50 n=1 Tax=Stieleria varia TaxID=2528005 RepID=A0A5C6B3E5_9BACT|nr:M50 family metallopeptidase [Stieleria varia]TWU06052.1 hypothetical protein Pla52n_17710 [Stieleria varia]
MLRSQLVMLAILLAWGWSVMTVTHELGHVAGALAQGAQVASLQLAPWQLPNSLFNGQHNELITLWSGPLIGCLVPILVAAIARHTWVSLVAAFCVVANGSYLLLGYFSGDAFLDSTQLLRAGTPDWHVLMVSVMMTVIGYLWFRRQCAALLSGPAIQRNMLWLTFVGWLGWVAMQTLIAT